MLVETESAMRIEANKYQSGNDRERFLLRQLSATAVIALFEQVWYTIFRSQTIALQFLNSTPIDIDSLRSFYDAAAAANPTLYEKYSFNHWLSYMRSFALIIEQVGMIHITVRGREFLKYLVETGKSVDSLRN